MHAKHEVSFATVIFEKTGDIFASEAQVLVNPVNRVGVMGAGLAKAFRDRWPAAYVEYKKFCDDGLMTFGTVPFFSIDDKWMACVATKDDWRNPSTINYVKTGVDELRTMCLPEHMNVDSIAIPALGCGLGGLSWRVVKPIVVAAFQTFPGDVYIYGPK